MDKWKKIKSKIKTAEQLKKIVADWQSENKKVVFTNGCFDIIHLGHVTYLAKAASLGNYLIVAVNDDDSIRKQNKGANRPINNQDARTSIIAALEVVDAVVIFSQETPLTLITDFMPDVLVKGADYDENEKEENSKKYIVGAKEVIANGGTVKTIALEKGFSTTNLIEKIKS